MQKEVGGNVNVLILILATLFSCHPGIEDTGDVTVRISVFNEFGNEVTKGIGGLKVVMDNGIFAITDEKGIAKFKNLKEGRYTVTVRQSGFQEAGDVIDLKGEDFYTELNLIEIPKTVISNLTVSKKNDRPADQLHVLIDFNVAPNDDDLWRRNLKIMVGKGVIGPECANCWPIWIRPSNPNGSVQYDVTFSAFNLKSIGVNSGDSVSVRIYPYAGAGNWNESKKDYDLIYGQLSDLVMVNY